MNIWKAASGTILALGLCCGAASAAPVQFTFTSGASVLDTLGNHEGLSGTFDYDSATGDISNSLISVTGPGPESGQYNGTQLLTFANDPVTGVNAWILGADFSNRVDLFFNVADLNSGAAALYNPGSGFFIACLGVVCTSYDDSRDGVRGGVVETVAGVPEPFTLSLLGAGLAGAAAMRRRKKA